MKTYLPQFVPATCFSVMLVLGSSSAAPVTFGVDFGVPTRPSMDLTRCSNNSFRNAITAKASDNKPLVGELVDGPFEVGGGDFADTNAIPGRIAFVDPGCFARYQNAWIYVSARTSASVVYGYIFDKWARLSWERGLGYPTSDEQDASGGGGRVSYFQYGVIYWKAGAGQAFAVYGLIGDQYYNQWAGPKTTLGYPVKDEQNWFPDATYGASRVSFFENGAIFWSARTGIRAFWGYVYQCWRTKPIGGRSPQGIGRHPVRIEINGDGSQGRITFDNGVKTLSARQGANGTCTVGTRYD